MEPIANGHIAGAPPVRARDEETLRGSELAAGLFELLARDAQASTALAGPRPADARATAQRGPADAADRWRSDAFAHTASAGALDEPRARDDLAVNRDDSYARPDATREAPAADPGDRAAVRSTAATDANPASCARGAKGAGDVGPHALAGAAGLAAGSGGSTGDSRGLRIDGSTEWTAPRSPSLTAVEGAGGAGTGAQAGLDGQAAGAPVTPQPQTLPSPAAVDTASALAFPALLSLDAATDPLAALTSSGALRAAVRAQAVHALVTAIQSRSREAVLTLDPPGLGRIRIHVRVTDDAVAARVSTERPEVGQMLRADRDLISARLAEQGLRLETLVVERGNRAIDARTASADGARLALTANGREGAGRGSPHAGDAAAGGARDGNDDRPRSAAAVGAGLEGASPSEDAGSSATRHGVDLRV